MCAWTGACVLELNQQLLHSVQYINNGEGRFFQRGDKHDPTCSRQHCTSVQRQADRKNDAEIKEMQSIPCREAVGGARVDGAQTNALAREGHTGRAV